MSRINRAIPRPADAATAAAANAAMSAYDSLLVNADNVRAEGVDYSTVEREVLTGEAGVILVDARVQHNGGATTQAYSSTATPSKAEISHGSGTRLTYGVSGQVIQEGDILRAYWQLVCTDFEISLQNSPRHRACWIVWLEWDITSNALGNWVAVPNQGDFLTPYTDVINTRGSAVAATPATMVIPHGLRYYDPVLTDNRDLAHDHFSAMRMYAYRHTGADIRIYGLRMVIAGLCYPWYTAGTPTNRIVREESLGRTQESVTIGAAQLGTVLMRED